jgi:hypothetical protein
MRSALAPSAGMRSAARHLPAAAFITLAVAGIILGPAAIFGGWNLASQPDGSGMQMPVSWLEHSPFADYLVPGLILLVVFGIGSFVLVALGLFRAAIAPYLAIALGAGQLIWIGVQLAMIRTWHPIMHPLLIAVGAALVVCGTLWWRAWRPAD